MSHSNREEKHNWGKSFSFKKGLRTLSNPNQDFESQQNSCSRKKSLSFNIRKEIYSKGTEHLNKAKRKEHSQSQGKFSLFRRTSALRKRSNYENIKEEDILGSVDIIESDLFEPEYETASPSQTSERSLATTSSSSYIRAREGETEGPRSETDDISQSFSSLQLGKDDVYVRPLGATFEVDEPEENCKGPQKSLQDELKENSHEGEGEVDKLNNSSSLSLERGEENNRFISLPGICLPAERTMEELARRREAFVSLRCIAVMKGGR
ncbi:uncharacterized protein LOC135145033 [Zophobas morio]|uniref:uncharacterized protein LOC135145033 n=1 Tax=Zophobas morio TaxID=2755281 RepID=UPI003082814F